MAADLIAEQNLKKQRVLEEQTPPDIREIIDKIASIEEPGIYNLIGRDSDVLTNVAWSVAVNNPGWEYVPWPSPVETLDSEKVVVDNVAATREASRRVREIRTFDAADIVVAVSRKPTPEITNTIKVGYDR